MDSRLAVAKISGAWRLVIRRMFEGAAGWDNGGRSERSRERFGEWRRRLGREGEAPVEGGGVSITAAIGVCCLLSQWWSLKVLMLVEGRTEVCKKSKASVVICTCACSSQPRCSSDE